MPPAYINNFNLWWCLHSNVYDLITITGCCKMCFYAGLLNCSVYGNQVCGADFWITPCHTAGTAQLSVDWLRPNWSASSRWNDPESGRPVWSEPVWAQVGHGSWSCHAPSVAAARAQVYEECPQVPKAADEPILLFLCALLRCQYLLIAATTPLLLTAFSAPFHAHCYFHSCHHTRVLYCYCVTQHRHWGWPTTPKCYKCAYANQAIDVEDRTFPWTFPFW